MRLEVLKDIYTFKPNYFDLDGLKYHYIDQGSGEPMLMLHGNPTWSIYYRKLVEAFSSEYRCIVPDHIGCGFSDKPSPENYEYTFFQRVLDLEKLVESLDLKNITLVVHDWGGIIGTIFAERNPERIKRMVIFNTAGFLIPKAKKLPLPLWLCRDTKLGAFLVKNFNAFSFIASHVACTDKKMSRKIRHAFRAPYDTPENRIATLKFVQDIPLSSKDKGYDILEKTTNNLSKLKHIPKLICWGNQDFVFDHHFLNEWVKHFPDAEVKVFHKAGHYVLEEEPEQIIKFMNEFFDKNKLG
ncbi:MAG: alpha/beta fold hydrolase [Candidatus Sericytochromatia bacterium]